MVILDGKKNKSVMLQLNNNCIMKWWMMTTHFLSFTASIKYLVYWSRKDDSKENVMQTSHDLDSHFSAC